MTELTEQSGATILFVSHDLGSVQQMCERVIWLDRGRVKMDADAGAAVKAYYLAVLEAEEHRKRRQRKHRARRLAGAEPAEPDERVEEVVIRLTAPQAGQPRFAHPVRRLRLHSPHGFDETVEVGSPMDNDVTHPAYVPTDQQLVDWSNPVVEAGRRCRRFEDCGGIECHAPAVFTVPAAAWSAGAFELEIEHASPGGEPVRVVLFAGGQTRPLGELAPADGDWRTQRFVLPQPPAPPATDTPAEAPSDRRASQTARFLSIVPLDADGRERHVFTAGEPFGFETVAEVARPLDAASFGVTIYAPNGSVVCQTIRPLAAPLRPGRCRWRVRYDRPTLRQSDYVCSFSLSAAFDEVAMDLPESYARWSRAVTIRIDEGYTGHLPLGLVKLPLAGDAAAALPVERLDD